MCSAKLDNCILGKNTRVGAKAELYRCVTQAGYEIQAGGELRLLHYLTSLYKTGADILKGEKLEVSDWTTTERDDDEGKSISDIDNYP